MSAIFYHAMRYEWIDRNPIKLIRQSAGQEDRRVEMWGGGVGAAW
jgi:hypothetical protein